MPVQWSVPKNPKRQDSESFQVGGPMEVWESGGSREGMDSLHTLSPYLALEFGPISLGVRLENYLIFEDV